MRALSATFTLLTMAAIATLAYRPSAASVAGAQPAAFTPAATDCPASVADLPSSELFDVDDPRLDGASLVVAVKHTRRLMLFERGQARRCFAMGLATDAPAGDKYVEGDRRTPEGWYVTSDKPESRFANAIAIHYPNADDANRALDEGRIDSHTHAIIVTALAVGERPPQQTAMGGDILIHGGGASDWTLGCLALADADLTNLRAALPAAMATNILILP